MTAASADTSNLGIRSNLIPGLPSYRPVIRYIPGDLYDLIYGVDTRTMSRDLTPQQQLEYLQYLTCLRCRRPCAGTCEVVARAGNDEVREGGNTSASPAVELPAFHDRPQAADAAAADVLVEPLETTADEPAGLPTAVAEPPSPAAPRPDARFLEVLRIAESDTRSARNALSRLVTADADHPDCAWWWLKLGELEEALDNPGGAATAYCESLLKGEDLFSDLRDGRAICRALKTVLASEHFGGSTGRALGTWARRVDAWADTELLLLIAEHAGVAGDVEAARTYFEAAVRELVRNPVPVLARATLANINFDTGRRRRLLQRLCETLAAGRGAAWKAALELAAAALASGVALFVNHLDVPGWFCLGLAGATTLVSWVRR